jgi:hypothetical protein
MFDHKTTEQNPPPLTGPVTAANNPSIDEMINDLIDTELAHKKTTFHTRQDIVRFMKRTGTYPIVRKRKADSGNAKEDYFELVKSFKKLTDARAFISTRLNYLIWYVPKEIS